MDQRGLYEKYEVRRKDGTPLQGDEAIVLEVGDILSLPAIRLHLVIQKAIRQTARLYEVRRTDGRPLKGGGALVLELGDPSSWIAIYTRAIAARLTGNREFAYHLLDKLRVHSGLFLTSKVVPGAGPDRTRK